MAKTSNRRINIFLNGKAVTGSIKDIKKEFRQLNNTIGDVGIETEAYQKKAKRLSELSSVIKQHRNNIRGISDSYSKVSLGLSKFLGIAGIAFGANEIIGYGKRVLELGISMDTLSRKAQTVFGEALPEVTREAERNATAMGLTVSQYTDAATAIADLLIPMGFQRTESAAISTELVNLSGALSEWTGGQKSAVEVSDILQKALLGEREQLKELGISIMEADVTSRLREKGLEKLTGTMLQQAKAAATLELITEKTVDAQTAFAEGGGTAIRRQAELTAKFQETQEKISQILLPVFEELLGALSGVANVMGGVADVFGNIANPIQGATDAFDEQAQKVAELEGELPALLTRYDELKDKSGKTEVEQAELAKTIQRIGEITPNAITEIDKYGNVLSINADASRDFLAAEQARLKFVNKESIGTLEAEIVTLEALLQLSKRVAEGKGVGLLNLAPSSDAINNARIEVGKLNQEIIGATAELNRLKGDAPAGGKKSSAKSPAQTEAEEAARIAKEEELRRIAESEKRAKEDEKEAERRAKARQKEAERELKDLDNKQQQLVETVAKFQEEARLNDLSEDARKIEELRLRYQAEIDEAIALEAQGVIAATEQRKQLEIIRDEEVGQLRDELLAARTEEEKTKQVESLKEINDAKLAEEERQRQEQLEIKAFLDESNLNERQLELQKLQENFYEVADLTGENDDQLLALLEAYRKRKQEINDKFDKTDRAQYVKAQKEQAEALAVSFQAAGTIIGGVMNAIGDDAVKNTILGKGLALAQIGFSSAEAIAKGTAASSGVPFPGNLIAIASTVATVLTNIGQARRILSATKTPQKKLGGYHNVRGADDNVTYRARYIGSPTTGMLPSSPVVLASEAGPEYFVSNKALQNPYVLNHVRAIENITKLRQFVDGGATQPLPSQQGVSENATNGNQNVANAVNLQLTAAINRLNANLESGIIALVDDDGVVNIFKKFNQLNSASGGALLQ